MTNDLTWHSETQRRGSTVDSFDFADVFSEVESESSARWNVAQV